MSFRDSFIALESRLYRRVLVADCNEFSLLCAVQGNSYGCLGAQGNRSHTRVVLKSRSHFSKKPFHLFRAKTHEGVRRIAPCGTVSLGGAVS